MLTENEAKIYALLQNDDLAVRLGRPPAKRPRKFQSVYAMYAEGKISARAASQMLNVSPGTFKRWTLDNQVSKDDTPAL